MRAFRGRCRRWRRLRLRRFRRRDHWSRLFRGFRFRLDRQQGLPDFDRLPLGHVDLDDLAGLRAGNLDHRLVGLDLDDAVIAGDYVPLAHQHADDVAAFDVLAQFGECEFDVHGLLHCDKSEVLLSICQPLSTFYGKLQRNLAAGTARTLQPLMFGMRKSCRPANDT